MKYARQYFKMIIITFWILTGVSLGQKVYDVKPILIAGECIDKLSLDIPDAGVALETNSIHKLCFELSYEAPEDKTKTIIFLPQGLPVGLNFLISEITGQLSEYESLSQNEAGTPGNARKTIFSSSDQNIVLIDNIQRVRVESRRFSIEFPKENIGFSNSFSGPFSLKFKMVDQYQ